MSAATLPRRMRVCVRCREHLPIEEFPAVVHVNRTTGVRVFHGWRDWCLRCGGERD
jgi:hypothetical protein